MKEFKIDYLIGVYLRHKYTNTIYKCVQSLHGLYKIDYVLQNVKTDKYENYSVEEVKTEFENIGMNKEFINTLFK